VWWRCVECGRELDEGPRDHRCPCGGLLEIALELDQPPSGWRERPLSVWRYRELLPVPEGASPVTLHEGGTRLVDAPRLAELAHVRRVQLKVEGGNPTGSFKDRGMTCAVTWAVHDGAAVLGCASTGNTAASMAAYGARAHVRTVVLLPAGKVAAGKLAQALAHGARVIEVEGSFDDAMAAVIELSRDGHLALLNSINPLRLEGQKTLMYEVLDQRDLAVPDRVVYPVGNAGNISAGHKALVDYGELGYIKDRPRLTGIQAEGAAPIVRALNEGAFAIVPIERPSTLATAIQIGRPVSALKALRAIRDTDGVARAVSDEQITDAQGLLARLEGVFAEPASAASVAGLLALAADGALDASEEVVCVLTGHGLKDPAAAERLAKPPITVQPERAALIEAIR